jgi:competence protein ComEA
MYFINRMMLVMALLLASFTVSAAMTEQQVKSGQAAEQPVIETVNINTADAATLARLLNGIGMKKAEAIVAHREKFGAFMTADELTEVKGIGKATLERNRSAIRVE